MRTFNQRIDKRPIGKRILWDRDSTTKLRNLVAEKYPINKIAKILNRTEKAIRRKCERLALSSSTTYTKLKPQ